MLCARLAAISMAEANADWIQIQDDSAVFEGLGADEAGRLKSITGFILVPLVIALYSSPIPVLRHIMSGKSTGNYSFVLFLLLVCNTFCWCVFALRRGIDLLFEPFIVNSYGLCINVAALTIFRCNITDAETRRKFDTRVPATVLLLLVLAVCLYFDPSDACREEPGSIECWWGKLTLIVNCLLFGGPISDLKKAWKTQSVEFLPLGPLIAGLLASCDCTIYFICVSDINGLIPNVVGVVMSAGQIMFYGYIVRKYPGTAASVELSENAGSSIIEGPC